MHPFRMLCFAFVLFGVVCGASLCFARDLAIIVDKGNTSSTVTTAELEKLLKAIDQQWPDGKKVKIFLTNPDSPDSKLIVQRLYKMAPDKVKSLIDSHKADIQVAGSDDLVLRLVANNPGSIGIVNIYSINSTVKVLKVDDKLPLEQGYLLHGN